MYLSIIASLSSAPGMVLSISRSILIAPLIRSSLKVAFTSASAQKYFTLAAAEKWSKQRSQSPVIVRLSTGAHSGSCRLS